MSQCFFQLLSRESRLPHLILLGLLCALHISCRSPLSPISGSGDTQLHSTSLIELPKGDYDRCDIYPQMYQVMMPHFRQVVSLWDQDQKKVKDEVTDEVARDIVKRTVQMLLNIMGMRARPIHPIAFFSVIKDFESSMDMTWSGGDESKGGTEKFSYSSPWGPMCDTNGEETDCMGLFQINLFDSDMTPALQSEEITPAFKAICGQGGLNLLGTKGSLDTCASLYWWLRNGADKCGLMLKDSPNPCTDATNDQEVYPWSPATFAYAHDRAYVQKNRLKGHNKDDPWRALYVGGRAPANATRDYFMGYEHCAARFFVNRMLMLLRQYSPKGKMAVGYLLRSHWLQHDAHNDVIRFTEPFEAGSPEHLDTDKGSELMRAAVADFAADIGLMPWWYAEWNSSREKTQQPPSPPVPQHKGKSQRR